MISQDWSIQASAGDFEPQRLDGPGRLQDQFAVMSPIWVIHYVASREILQIGYALGEGTGMKFCRLAAIAFVALPLAVPLALTVESTKGLADTSFSSVANVRVYRGIEKHPNYQPSGRHGIRVFRGKPNDPPVTRESPRRTDTKRRSSVRPVPRNQFLAGPGARTPYPYWPPWRQTYIPTHCAPRWMC